MVQGVSGADRGFLKGGSQGNGYKLYDYCNYSHYYFKQSAL